MPEHTNNSMNHNDIAKDIMNAVIAALNNAGSNIDPLSELDCRRVCVELNGIRGSKHIHHENEKIHNDDIVLSVIVRAKLM